MVTKLLGQCRMVTRRSDGQATDGQANKKTRKQTHPLKTNKQASQQTNTQADRQTGHRGGRTEGRQTSGQTRHEHLREFHGTVGLMAMIAISVSYKQLTLPTNLTVQISLHAASSQKKQHTTTNL